VTPRHIYEQRLPAAPIGDGLYSLIQILADAIERAATLDPEAVRDAIAATDLDTVVGHVTFREDGTSPIENPLMQRQSGAVELVWPAEAATAELLYPAN
jgi:branched-chain amino acid transport system substrate-binding protein